MVLIVVDQILNAIFFIDMIVNFRTSFYNSRGEEVFNPKEIARDYIFSNRFISDFCACFPWDRIITTRGDVIKSFGIMKLIRVSRLN
jgi:hypothetical protein